MHLRIGRCNYYHGASLLILEVLLCIKIFLNLSNEAEKRNLRERTIQLYCSDELPSLEKNVSDLQDAIFLAKRLEGWVS